MAYKDSNMPSIWYIKPKLKKIGYLLVEVFTMESQWEFVVINDQSFIFMTLLLFF